MVLLKRIERSAAVAWCPVDGYVATGTAAGAMSADFEASSHLEIFKVDFTDRSDVLKPVGSIQAEDRFHQVAWGAKGADDGTFPLGIIAGGLADGSVTLWDAQKVLSGDEEGAVIATVRKHTSPVLAIEFNPYQQNLLASGSLDSEVFVWDLANPSAPALYSPVAKTPAAAHGPPAEITAIGWNRKVMHILAAATSAGACCVYDLKLKKQIIRITDKRKRRFSALSWNPEVSTQVVLAVDDSTAPVLQVWDLRQALAPIRELTAHTEGILSVSWCPNDAGLLLSCAKDNQCLAWDPHGGRVVSELPVTNNWNFDVQWSPRNPSILSLASFEGTIELHALTEYKAADGRLVAPKWLHRPVGVAFGFGGQLLSFSQPPPLPSRGRGGSADAAGSAADGRFQIHVQRFASETDLVARAQELDDVLSNSKLREMCESRSASARDGGSEDAARVWECARLLFDRESRSEIAALLGFSEEEVEEAAKAAIAADELTPEGNQQSAEGDEKSSAGDGAAPTSGKESDGTNDAAAEAEPEREPSDVSELFGASQGGEEFSLLPAGDEGDESGAADGMAGEQSDAAAADAEARSLLPDVLAGVGAFGDDADDLAKLRRAVVRGDFAAAVALAQAAGRYADALVLASCGGDELFAATRAAFLSEHTAPVMKLVGGILTHRLADLVDAVVPGRWAEALALLCSFASAEEFKPLCTRLGDRLTADDSVGALPPLLCYLCGGNVERVLSVAEAVLHKGNALATLQEVVEIVIAMLHTHGADRACDAAAADKMAEYAELLASQGEMTLAARFLKMVGAEQLQGETRASLLGDRLYHADPTASMLLVESNATFSGGAASLEADPALGAAEGLGGDVAAGAAEAFGAAGDAMDGIMGNAANESELFQTDAPLPEIGGADQQYGDAHDSGSYGEGNGEYSSYPNDTGDGGGQFVDGNAVAEDAGPQVPQYGEYGVDGAAAGAGAVEGDATYGGYDPNQQVQTEVPDQQQAQQYGGYDPSQHAQAVSADQTQAQQYGGYDPNQQVQAQQYGGYDPSQQYGGYDASQQAQAQQYGGYDPSQQAQAQQYGGYDANPQVQAQAQQYGGYDPSQQAQAQQYGGYDPNQQAQAQAQQFGGYDPSQQAQAQQQYGMYDPNQQAQAQAPQQTFTPSGMGSEGASGPAPAPKVAKAPKAVKDADTSSVAAELVPIAEGVKQLFSVCESSPDAGKFKKMISDANKKLALMLYMLNGGVLSDETTGLLLEIVSLLQARDVQAAKKKFLVLSRVDFQKNKNWTSGVKVLSELVQKLGA